MKTFTTVLFLLVALSTVNATTNSEQESLKSRIVLKGHYEKGDYNHARTRSLSMLLIQAFLDGTNLCIEFSSSISELNITLIKEGVEVKNKTIMIEVGQSEIIDLSAYELGSYYIILTTPQGIYLYGEFYLM